MLDCPAVSTLTQLWFRIFFAREAYRSEIRLCGMTVTGDIRTERRQKDAKRGVGVWVGRDTVEGGGGDCGYNKKLTETHDRTIEHTAK